MSTKEAAKLFCAVGPMTLDIVLSSFYYFAFRVHILLSLFNTLRVFELIDVDMIAANCIKFIEVKYRSLRKR